MPNPLLTIVGYCDNLGRLRCVECADKACNGLDDDDARTRKVKEFKVHFGNGAFDGEACDVCGKVVYKDTRP